MLLEKLSQAVLFSVHTIRTGHSQVCHAYGLSSAAVTAVLRLSLPEFSHEYNLLIDKVSKSSLSEP